MTGTQVDMIGVLAVGVGAAATLYAALHALRRAGYAPAGWILPAGIGAAMIGYSIWADYAWFDRAAARLPAGSVILLEGRSSTPLAPWSYLAPPVVRFAALDPATRTTDAQGISRAAITLVERRAPTLVVPQEFDCARGLIRPARADWAQAATGDPAFAAVCASPPPG